MFVDALPHRNRGQLEVIKRLLLMILMILKSDSRPAGSWWVLEASNYVLMDPDSVSFYVRCGAVERFGKSGRPIFSGDAKSEPRFLYDGNFF